MKPGAGRYVKKAWGTTQCLIDTPFMQLHTIAVDPGGFCSIHKHHGRANVFYVQAGSLVVRTWEGRRRRLHLLLPGDHLTVQPGVKHQFQTDDGAIVLEIYYPVLSLTDIERFTVGGRRR